MTESCAPRAAGRPGPRGGRAGGTGRTDGRGRAGRTGRVGRAPADPDDGERLPSPGFAYRAQTWREIAHLLANLPLGVAGFTYVSVWLYAGAALSVTVIGLPVLALGLLGARQFGKLERARARVLLALPVEEPSPIRGRAHGGFFPWLWSSLKDPVGWRTVLYSLIRLPWGVLTFTVTLVSLFAAWPVLGWTARALTHGDRAMVRGLLSPSDELERRIAELESGRGTVVDTAAADLRRIERDLHDGAQARLVALAMDLGLAREKLLEDPQAAAKMVDEAHGEVKTALRELRDLARGIHPAILTDRGLGPALSHLAARCTVPVTVTTDLPHRPAPAIEGIAYFTVSELLQNISKHSGARTARVEMWRNGDRLLVLVRDDGKGGASPDGGSGLTGLAERLEAVDGLFVLDSPPGGPTTVTAELPWRERPVA
ncbi:MULTISPECIES: sensor histidine kinase [Streptomyces]|uniref:histidine kinase n=2 Tax=Streptomyces TaxID=1883 RepID=A0A3R7ER73_9ACTN|nr:MULTISPECIES: sensor histidine kinase [Streptomyces]KNE80687.1 histidine kinase [Streptomyces fradiae]OFA44048.1 histidine kinase [Streptomyces fradiae]PQM21484.1 sensor histidine kinase [Streptomyces xinghaiensis]RKM94457.1 sensor histidine kinase [Streptomyces xinghaiensis]RNC72056.1 sensor histidine kinase [Streptomyces xinghaiensis]